MTALIKSEFRKLLTVRSTYALILIPCLIITLMSFYFEGWKGNTGSAASLLTDEAIGKIVFNTAPIVAVFLSFVAILSVGHEYRYNMILYTLTANVNRGKVLLSKALAVGSFSVIAGLFCIAYSVVCYYAGLAIRGASLPHQDIQVLDSIGKLAFYFLGYSMIALIITFILRSQIASIVFFFVFSTFIQQLLIFLLKEKADYLPYTAFDSIIGVIPNVSYSVQTGIFVGIIYIVVGLLVSWILFVKRDAT